MSKNTCITMLAAYILAACSPQYNWRDYRSPAAPYTALFPGKPATLTRMIDLDGIPVSMTMTASDMDGINFAIGSAELPDAGKARTALLAIKTALVRNIGGTISSEKAVSATTTDIEVHGSRNGQPIVLAGRLAAKDRHVYQVIVIGKEKRIKRDDVDMFLTSFKLD